MPPIETDEQQAGGGNRRHGDGDGLYRRVLEAVSDVVLVHCPDGEVIAANGSARRGLGLDFDELVGYRWSDIPVHPVHQDGSPLSEADYPAHQTLRSGEASDEVVVGIQHDDGGLRWMKTSAEPIEMGGEDADGQPRIGAVCSFSDVTDQLEAARMKSEFVSVVSHELRTPTACIRSALGLIGQTLAGTVDERVARLLEIADTNALRLSRLIDDILDIERIESGRASLALRQTTSAELVERSVTTVRPMAESAGVSLVVSEDSVDSWLWADPDRVVQALVNLLSNAIKFSPDGGTVTVTSGYEDRRATLAVTDEGRGIPADMLDRVFQRFEQVDASDSRAKGGTGLGLAICRSIVQQHDGDVSVASEVGVGSTFTISLRARSTLEELESEDAGATVILCCPDPDWAPVAVLQGLFHQAGCRAVRVDNVDKALELAREQGADALVLDPGPNGSPEGSLVAQLSADPTAAYIPAVLVVRSEMTVDNTIEFTMRSKKVEPMMLVKWVVALLEDALTETTSGRF